jgi:predicted mannosyl-3-phosphoglycerate phosphatase (HAD superfamily)
MQIFLDFDGTVVEHYYPLIDSYNSGAKEVISKLQCSGHDIIVNTYRVEIEDNSLQEAISYLSGLDLLYRIAK